MNRFLATRNLKLVIVVVLRVTIKEPGIRNAPVNRSRDRESRVLILYTGGTIGMMKNDKNAYVPIPEAFEKYIRRIPYMHDEEYRETSLSSSDKSKFLVLPEVTDKTRVLYQILEYSPLMDSSNMGMDSWIGIAQYIQPSRYNINRRRIFSESNSDELSISSCTSTRRRRVLVLYTGGTIGMMADDDGALVPIANGFEKYLRRIPFLNDVAYAEENLTLEEREYFLVCPAAVDRASYNVLYHITEYSPLLDSSNMDNSNWIQIAKDVQPSQSEKRVMLLHLGSEIGTVRVKHQDTALLHVPNTLEAYLRKLPFMCDDEYSNEFLNECDRKKFIVLPDKKEKNRVLYHIQEFKPLLVAQNIALECWLKIADVIQKSYEAYDGFVILHGTDTLAYTASALSFMFENLGKPVIITGSQIPVFESRSDGRDNILGALILAGNYIIPEVTVFFRNKLFRGNRIMKKSTDAFLAFDSPNMTPIAKIGINIEVDFGSVFRPSAIDKFRVHSTLNPNVGLLRIFPNITIQAVKAFLRPPIEGVVLQTYGAGNIPSNREDLLNELKTTTKRGVLIVNCTQCIEGSVSASYETGMILNKIGVIPGNDMTPEAALTKLSYVLSKSEWDITTKREMLQKNLRGELTSEKSFLKKEDRKLSGFEVYTKEEQSKLENILLPALVINNVVDNNIPELKTLKDFGADFSMENSDFRTPLHVACCEGSVEMVEYLLLNGASVHMKDRYDNTPLMDAIHFDNHDIIELLVKAGAHLVMTNPQAIGSNLCSAAANGKLNRLQSYQLARVNLNEADFSGNTALHMAALHGNKEIVTYLLDMKADPTVKNMLNETPGDLAQRINRDDIANLLIKKFWKK